jgi:hypothetical protein
MIRRRFSLDGVSGPDEMGRTINPVVILDADGMSPEYSFYAKEFRFICWGGQGGVALEFTYFHLQNPSNSNHITIIKGIWGNTLGDPGGQAAVGVYRNDVAPGVAPVGHCATDTRWGPAPRPGATVVTMGTAAAITGTLHFTPRVTVRDGNFTDWAWDGDYVLLPGTGLTLWSRIVDVDLDFNVSGRERMLTRWEKE